VRVWVILAGAAALTVHLGVVVAERPRRRRTFYAPRVPPTDPEDRMPLAVAARALLEECRPLTRDEVASVAALPLDALPDLVALAHRVRLAYCGPEVELESLINAKSGACPEDCAFCSQSARFETGVDVYAFLDLDEVVGAARATRDAGATQFCIVVAVRGPEERLLRKVLEAVDAVHRETGLEVACSLGLLTRAQAERLAAAGVRRYNHNLETCREVFPSICTTHSWDDRVETARTAVDVGMELCCGGILGMGETLEQRIDFAFELAALSPCEVPINLLDPRPGTPLGDRSLLAPREALQAIALFRLVMPEAWIRLAGGRERVLGELQAMGLLAGANALIIGNYLTTIGRQPEADLALLDTLGMPVADGPGEGRFVVDATGTHARPARGPSIPVRAE
jgi:biotin synthase